MENMPINRCGKNGKHANKSSWEKWKTCQQIVVQEKRKKLAKKSSLKKKERKGKSLISEKNEYVLLISSLI